MQALTPRGDYEAFFERVRTAPERVLMLDYDGTLAPFHVERAQAVPYPGVRERLTRLVSDRQTRLVIMSGRACEDLRPLVGIEPPPELWGNHGGERLTPDGRYCGPTLTEAQRHILAEAAQWLDDHAAPEHCERKPASVALHVRGLAPAAADTLMASTRRAWEHLAGPTPMTVHDFDGGVELRPADQSKATAVATIVAESADTAALAYLGDDLTDEDAFRALGGRGLAVLVRAQFRDTAADLWLTPPDELLAFLDRWAAVSPR